MFHVQLRQEIHNEIQGAIGEYKRMSDEENRAPAQTSHHSDDVLTPDNSYSFSK